MGETLKGGLRLAGAAHLSASRATCAARLPPARRFCHRDDGAKMAASAGAGMLAKMSAKPAKCRGSSVGVGAAALWRDAHPAAIVARKKYFQAACPINRGRVTRGGYTGVSERDYSISRRAGANRVALNAGITGRRHKYRAENACSAMRKKKPALGAQGLACYYGDICFPPRRERPSPIGAPLGNFFFGGAGLSASKMRRARYA